jgi:prepilin-type N-terminal cleavage/methylation domain-containing protein
MNRFGLTIVEVLVALVIIAVAFMALASMQISNMQVTRDSRVASIAMQIGNEVLEQVTRDIYQGTAPNFAIYDYYDCNPCESSGTFPSEDFPYITEELFPNLEAYSYHVIITNLYDAPVDPTSEQREMDEFLNEGLLQVEIEISGASSVRFSAYVSCYDVSQTPTLEEGLPCPQPYNPFAYTGG